MKKKPIPSIPTSLDKSDTAVVQKMASIKPFYNTVKGRICYIGVGKDTDGKPQHKDPEPLADALHLIGRGVDESGNHYRILRWRDKLTGELKTDVLAMAEIGSNVGWQILLSKGITVLANRRRRDYLADYLQQEGSNDRWAVRNKAGWYSQSYILPSGEVLPETTQEDNKSRQHIIFTGDKSQAPYFKPSGCLKDWQDNIGRYAVGNSRLCLALGCAFAAPLMRLLDIEGGGFHLFGDSSDGKTTSAKVALSVWGKPDELKLSWDGTKTGFANIGFARNDGFMLLDEIGEANASTVKATAYALLNGTDRSRGAKTGGNQPLNTWRVLLLSTGELTLEAYLRGNGTELHAGQAARLPSIPADAGKNHGVFDELHGFENGASLAEHLNIAVNQFYGTTGRLFIERLSLDIPNAKKRLKTNLNVFLNTLPNLSHQSRRIGQRFALIAAALDLASYYGILSLTREQIQAAIKQCFDDWAAREGTGKRENRQILEQAIGFMQMNGRSRFIDLAQLDRFGDSMRDLAGYVETPTIKDEAEVYYVIPKVFVDELAKGFDTAKVCEVLNAANGWLQKLDGRWQKQKRVNGTLQRFYVFIGLLPDEGSLEEKTEKSE